MDRGGRGGAGRRQGPGIAAAGAVQALPPVQVPAPPLPRQGIARSAADHAAAARSGWQARGARPAARAASAARLPGPAEAEEAEAEAEALAAAVAAVAAAVAAAEAAVVADNPLPYSTAAEGSNNRSGLYNRLKSC